MASLVSRFTRSLGRFGVSKGGDSVLGVDIGSSSIKVVQLKREQGRAVLETYGVAALGPYAGSEIGRAVRVEPSVLARVTIDLSTEANITTSRAVVAIPLRASLLTLIELPGIAGANLDEIIRIEARKYIPVPIGEVQLDWTVIPKSESQRFETLVSAQQEREFADGTEVLLLAIHNNVIANYRQIVTEAKLDAVAYEIEVFSAIRAVFGHEIAPTMLIDFGASTTKIVIVDYGIVRLSHTINKGSQDITYALSKSMGISFDKAEEYKRNSNILTEKTSGFSVGPTIDYLFFEANRVLISYQKKYRRTIDKVLLTGGGSYLSGLRERAVEKFTAEVVYGNPFEKVTTPGFLEQKLAGIGPEFSVAVGAALRGIQELR
ncbi:MAG: type IV pilus assembly protein PilM [bacterium]|nr:type IV pilus assembly protein PilM [bacterium]